MPLPPATPTDRTTDSRSPEPTHPADPHALCLRACDILLGLGFASDQIVVVLDGAEYRAAPPAEPAPEPTAAGVADDDAGSSACPPLADARDAAAPSAGAIP